MPNELLKPEYFFNRELSWLEFNYRVLHEALDERTPLLERLKFLAIFSSNLDEFFMVRVAGLKKQVKAGVTKLTPDGRTPAQQLADIGKRLHPLISEQSQHFEQVLRAELVKEGIHLVNYVDLSVEQRNYLHSLFNKEIFPILTPLAVDPGHPFPFISNLSFNLAVSIKKAGQNTELFARVKVPKVLPRFIELPSELAAQTIEQPVTWMGVPIEQIVAHNLESLFPGMEIFECHPFRVTRNADISVEEDEADDLMLAIQEGLRRRRVAGTAVRIELTSTMPENVKSVLMRELELDSNDVYVTDGLLGLGNLFYFLGLPRPELKDIPWEPQIPLPFRTFTNVPEERSGPDTIFDLIQQQDQLVHHPYHSFAATVQKLIEQAARDPQVMAIKMTLYRTSGDSPIIKSLMEAAENGKQVVVLVELKARFDEENNILWAQRLEQSGVHVVYGLVGLKTHTKITLVVRKESGGLRRYVHIGTGNYNPKTAKLYTDLGLFSCREELGCDLSDLFNYLTGYSQQNSFRKLLIAPVTLRDRLLSFVKRETEHAKASGSGRIVAKMNSLVDPTLITALYEAARAGVKIDLIIRGICCLRPGIPDISENIRVISVIGRFLEHSRIFYFHNQGQEEIYIGSADLMPRNLDRRVEAVTPIEDLELVKNLQEFLGTLLADSRQAWELRSDGQYEQRRPALDEELQGTHDILITKTLAETALR
ncbi:MAG: polyphosphate kinase 1 [Cyanobacteria bacterium P01_H01_bin.15]